MDIFWESGKEALFGLPQWKYAFFISGLLLVCIFWYYELPIDWIFNMKRKWYIFPSWELCSSPLGEPQLTEDKGDCPADEEPNSTGKGVDTGGASNPLRIQLQTSGCLGSTFSPFNNNTNTNASHHHSSWASCMPCPVFKVLSVETLP